MPWKKKKKKGFVYVFILTTIYAYNVEIYKFYMLKMCSCGVKQ